MFFYEIAVDAPLFKTFTYKSHLDLIPGTPVVVPFGKRKIFGVILKKTIELQDPSKTKEVYETCSELPVLSKEILRWIEWISEYYIFPIGPIFTQCFPPLKKSDRQSKKTPITFGFQNEHRPGLTEEQSQAAKQILDTQGFQAHLLFGITGSGKTEVYLDVLEKKIAQGKKGLVLVPEISLTPQLIRRFVERFGEQVAVIHSQLTEREKTNQWWSVVEGNKKILIGARSALFCPIPNLGFIVIDEEHESSFKQDEKLKYNARDCAIMLAKELQIPICLGSATPSLETWKNSLDGKYQLHRLTKRVTSEGVAPIHVVDMRELKQEEESELPAWLSKSLFTKIQETLENRKQVALFLNRRGQSQVVICKECGYTYMCPNCDISLSLHAKTHLNCHYCGYHEDLRPNCKSCHVGEIKPIGIGTEKIEEDIQSLFPKARTIRMDRDEVNDRESLEASIQKIEENQVDIIIGTQMIAKGLDFKNLTLVGIVLADIGFNIPDFRTAERNYQLLTQVSGRAGRHSCGDVFIQTYNPGYPSLTYAQHKGYEDFATNELINRKELFYPPYGKLMSIRIHSLNYEQLQEYCDRVQMAVAKFAFGEKFQVLGPTPSPIFKIKNKYRYGMLIKASSSKQIRNFYTTLIKKLPPPSTVQVTADMDPLNTF